MDGILNINKPALRTSFSIVAQVKRLTGERHAGHAGTLDPAATGVLPVCLGQGTRITEFLMDASKTYRAQIELGVTTDTYDATGKVTYKGDPSGVTRGQVETALATFCGSIQQLPPMYSAVKHHGEPLYKLARAGITVERKSRLATIHRLEMIGWQPPEVTIEVECGKGTYIRSLAHDLGQMLGCGASLKSLVRLKCGIFDIKDAISVSQLEDTCRCGYWQQFVYPIDSVLSHLAAVVVSEDTSRAIRNGCPIDYPELPFSTHPSNYCRVYTRDGGFLAVMRFNAEEKKWQPAKVFL